MARHTRRHLLPDALPLQRLVQPHKGLVPRLLPRPDGRPLGGGGQERPRRRGRRVVRDHRLADRRRHRMAACQRRGRGALEREAGRGGEEQELGGRGAEAGGYEGEDGGEGGEARADYAALVFAV